ncbi:hypothetical protein [Fodinibius halophilus]|uniref:Outer membrane beta-barrel protein n=1 Tax=Fodinibius halophilus TaxID=1736908 RepID=A0A6M1T6N9_9BACT|nr:hypothetical protein [Fodinibius halophilus]NGP88293.1 hypothetical protein [Fodinibius halophilus]
MRLLIISIALILVAPNLHAQEHKGSLLSFQQKTTPNFELYGQHHTGLSPWELEASAYNSEISPIEAGAYLSSGYPSYIAISYGLNLAYLYPINSSQLLKAGINVGRFKMNSFDDTVEVGAVLEDEFHESFKPFVEWQWNFSKYISLFAQAGYRFLRTETETVKKILSRYENGLVKSYRVSHNTDFYGSGFELGVGVSLRL